MSIRKNTSRHLSNTVRKSGTQRSNVGVVVDVIIDDKHKRIVDADDKKTYKNGKYTYLVGACVIRKMGNTVADIESLNTIQPLSRDIELPLIGEVVELVYVGSQVYYRRINKGVLNVGNSIPKNTTNYFPGEPDNVSRTSNYKESSKTGITSTKSTSKSDKLGKYFKETQTNPLKLYEGDKLIQSRFGQSIRFSGYNNQDNKFAPTIIIRNRQSDISTNKLGKGDLIEEDINRDGSILLMSSGDYLMDFQPGTVDDGGSSDFETKPDSFQDYPSSLKGIDQTLISSDRIIISSKSSEMIFYSKKNYGFISDGAFSIDNKKGANLTFGDDVIIKISDKDYNVNTGNGKVLLNTDNDDEPLVRGDKLVKILEDLLDEIIAQVYKTPSGPTDPMGPTNASKFRKIKSKLKDIKSTKNFTE